MQVLHCDGEDYSQYTRAGGAPTISRYNYVISRYNYVMYYIMDQISRYNL